MSTLLTIPDTAELLAHTLTALKAAGYASAAMIPVHKNTSNEGEKTEVQQPATAPEVYVAPGKQYANAQEALAHMVRELKNPERDNYNETLDFTFASLAQLLDILREPIYQHGLMLKQEFQKGDELPLDMVTTFIHIPTSTEVTFRLPAFMKEDKRLDECQRVGATFSYFRRYGLRQALDITDGDDDIDQADSKRERRKARAMNSSRKWRPTTSSRTKPESILNVLVASGEFAGSATVAQAKSRNPFLRTPSEVAEDAIRFHHDSDGSDEAMARDTVARFGLTDTFWQEFYSGYCVDGDELIDNKTGKHVAADVAMDIADSITTWAISAADANSVTDTRDAVSTVTASAFVPDKRPTTPEEEAFISAVVAGHDDEIAEIAERLLGADIAMGLDIKAERNDTRYARRNWLKACKVFYTNALLAGNANFSALPSVHTQPEQRIDAPNEMQQKADIAREIATGNSDADTKLQQLHEIAQRCDPYTTSYIDTLILHVECDGLNSELPVYIPESDLPY